MKNQQLLHIFHHLLRCCTVSSLRNRKYNLFGYFCQVLFLGIWFKLFLFSENCQDAIILPEKGKQIRAIRSILF